MISSVSPELRLMLRREIIYARLAHSEKAKVARSVSEPVSLGYFIVEHKALKTLWVKRWKVMATHQVDLNEAKAQLSKLIEAAQRGEDVLIMLENQPIAKIVPVTPTRLRPQFGSAKGMIVISDDFDEPLEEFREYME